MKLEIHDFVFFVIFDLQQLRVGELESEELHVCKTFLEESACKQEPILFRVGSASALLLLSELVFFHVFDALREAHVCHAIVFLLHHNRSNIGQTLALLVVIFEVVENAECFEIVEQCLFTVMLLKSRGERDDLGELIVGQIELVHLG